MGKWKFSWDRWLSQCHRASEWHPRTSSRPPTWSSFCCVPVCHFYDSGQKGREAVFNLLCKVPQKVLWELMSFMRGKKPSFEMLEIIFPALSLLHTLRIAQLFKNLGDEPIWLLLTFKVLVLESWRLVWWPHWGVMGDLTGSITRRGGKKGPQGELMSHLIVTQESLPTVYVLARIEDSKSKTKGGRT